MQNSIGRSHPSSLRHMAVILINNLHSVWGNGFTSLVQSETYIPVLPYKSKVVILSLVIFFPFRLLLSGFDIINNQIAKKSHESLDQVAFPPSINKGWSHRFNVILERELIVINPSKELLIVNKSIPHKKLLCLCSSTIWKEHNQRIDTICNMGWC